MDDVLQQRWLKGGDKCSRTFFSTFKKKSLETELFELLSHDGAVLKDWEEIAEEVISYFTEAFRSRQQGDRSVDFEYLLRNQDARIPSEARERLEELPTLEDLRKAAMCLNKLRSPGPDGIPIEFYLILWESIGHLLHTILLDGLHDRQFCPVFIRGVIVLLPK